MPQSLQNNHIVIVGASSGLGKALAEKLSTEKAHLYLLSRSSESVSHKFDAVKITCDVRDAHSIKDAFKKVDDQTKTIDILINCAGVGLVKNLEDTTPEEIQNVLQTNLLGGIVASQEGYKRMLEQGSGHIINVTSTSGTKARPDETVYCASKAGLRLFTESLRIAAAKHKIRVTAVAPGGMNTPFWKGSEPRNLETFMDPSDIADQIIHLLKSPNSIAPSELVIERGV